MSSNTAEDFMAEGTGDIFSILNHLIQTCRDGEDGFRSAAEAVKNTQLKSMFLDYSEQRAKFANELQLKIARLGGHPKASGSLAAAAHRGWMSLKTTLTGHHEGTVIAECGRGEDAAIHAYEKALSRDMPSEMRELIQCQREQVREAHHRVRALELKVDDTLPSPRASKQ